MNAPIDPIDPPTQVARRGTALLLTGGGARAAYQVGVLQALAALRRHNQPGRQGSPFDIIVGTSAGAINAAALATGADRFGHAVARLSRIWRAFGAAQVYRSEARDAARAGARPKARGVASARRISGRPRNSSPASPSTPPASSQCTPPASQKIPR